jgi:hypothetical protein
VSDGTIRVDRVVLEIHHAMTAARAKPQVTGPDEFSARTPSHRGPDPEETDRAKTIRRRDRLGGLVHEYYADAA